MIFLKKYKEKVLLFMILLGMWFSFYLLSFTLYEFIEVNYPIGVIKDYLVVLRKKNGIQIRLIIAFILLMNFILLFIKKENFAKIIMKWFIITLIMFFTTVVVAEFVNITTFWFLIFLIPLIVGLLSSFMFKNEKNIMPYKLFSMMISFLFIMFCEGFQYLLILEASTNPKIYSIATFSHPIFWVLSVFLVLIISLFFTNNYFFKSYRT